MYTQHINSNYYCYIKNIIHNIILISFVHRNVCIYLHATNYNTTYHSIQCTYYIRDRTGHTVIQ